MTDMSIRWIASLSLGAVLAVAACGDHHTARRGPGEECDPGECSEGYSCGSDGICCGCTSSSRPCIECPEYRFDAAPPRDSGGRSDACGPVDPGWCAGGPCCDDRVRATLDETTCSGRCPVGYSHELECEPDPAADCVPRWMLCEANADCVLATNTCCGPCGVPTLDHMDPINATYSDDHRESVCPDPGGPCPDCATMPNNFIGATCDAGWCEEYDLRSMELTACTEDSDCRLRVTDCCECGGDVSPASLIAIRSDAETDYAALVCDDTDCPGCAPVYPTEVEAYCADDGHCDVRATSP